jgi:hypothetical protein
VDVPGAAPSVSLPLPFDCRDPNARSPSLSYTLTKTQYQNSVSDLFGSAALTAVSSQLSVLSPDIFDKASNARTTGITNAKVDAYFYLAKAIATWVVSSQTRTSAVFGACATAATPGASCIDTYLNGFARRVFRRPLTADEVAFARQLASRSGTFADNLRTLLTLHLTSPAFLWQLELGEGVVGGQVKLTAYEVASRIAFETTDSTPDAALMAAAEANQLSTVDQIRAQVSRLLLTAHGKQKVRDNLLRWSQQNAVHNVDGLPSALTTGIEMSGLSQAMLDEAAAYVDYQVYDQGASFQTLLTSKASLASHPGLAAIYGHAPASAAAPGTFSGRRQGLLMRAPLLTSAVPRASAIHRGVAFARFVLCNDIPPPDPSIVNIRSAHVFTPEEMVDHTTREAITFQTSEAACMGCHGLINPNGFAFENVDPLGRLRSQEMIFNASGQLVKSLPIDASTQVPFAGALLAVQDAYDLTTYVATSSEGSACFVRNAQRFVLQRRETAEDACTLESVQKIVADPKRPILDALTALIGNEAIFDKRL